MATTRRTFPVYESWTVWAQAGTMALLHGDRESFRDFIEATMAVTVFGMFQSGMRPASHPTSATKE